MTNSNLIYCIQRLRNKTYGWMWLWLSFWEPLCSCKLIWDAYIFFCHSLPMPSLSSPTLKNITFSISMDVHPLYYLARSIIVTEDLQIPRKDHSAFSILNMFSLFQRTLRVSFSCFISSSIEGTLLDCIL